MPDDVDDPSEDGSQDGPVARPLTAPRDGVPDVVTTPDRLAEAAAALAAADGPVAVDAERASGYRYGQRAFLVQLRREGAGTWLIDPVPLPDLSSLGEALGDGGVGAALGVPGPAVPGRGRPAPRRRAVRHRARRPARRPREGGPGLGGRAAARLAARQGALGGRLVHPPDAASPGSATPRSTSRSWSTCATPSPACSRSRASSAGRARSSPPSATPRRPPRARTRGAARPACTRSAAAAAWPCCASCGWSATASPSGATSPPGRVLPDRALVNAASVVPTSTEQLTALPVFSGPSNRRQAHRWLGAIERGRRLPERDLPPHALPGDGPPPPRAWKDRDPEAAATADPLPRGGDGAGRAAPAAGGEPAHPRPAAPAVLAPAAGRLGRRDRRRPWPRPAPGPGRSGWWPARWRPRSCRRRRPRTRRFPPTGVRVG